MALCSGHSCWTSSYSVPKVFANSILRVKSFCSQPVSEKLQTRSIGLGWMLPTKLPGPFELLGSPTTLGQDSTCKNSTWLLLHEPIPMVNSLVSIVSESSSEPLTGFMLGETVPSRNGLVQECFEAQVLGTPGAIALELEGVTLTYRELNAGQSSGSLSPWDRSWTQLSGWDIAGAILRSNHSDLWDPESWRGLRTA